jgi:hypothetical protein
MKTEKRTYERANDLLLRIDYRRIASRFLNFMKDARLGRLIREEGISVMRIEDDRAGDKKWSACNASMGFDFGHDGMWGNASTPMDAARSVSKHGFSAGHGLPR